MALPRDQLPIGEGLHPDGSDGANFYMDRSELDVLEEDGPEWKLDIVRFIPESIEAPDAIFQGLNRPKQHEALAYSVRLTHDPAEETLVAVPPRFGYVFLAFVRPGQGGYIVFDWEWRVEAAEEPGHPEDWSVDFARRTWHRN